MVERRELINVFRQIGIMMQAGVDFLRITHVLRAQTENPRLAALYNSLDHDLTMGMSLADAMARQPDIFSPLAVSLVRQTEMRSDMAEMSQDLAAAFLRVADYLQQEAAPVRTRGNYNATGADLAPTPPDAKLGAATTTIGPDTPLINAPATDAAERQTLPAAGLSNALPAPCPATGREAPGEGQTLIAALEVWRVTLQLIALRALVVLSLLCTALAALEGSVAFGWLEPRWLGVALWGVSALFMGGATLWLWQRGRGRSVYPAPVVLEAVAQPAPPDNASNEVSAQAHLEAPLSAPAATALTSAATATDQEALDESWHGGDESGEPGAAAPNEPAPIVTRGNWADLKRGAHPSALPIWARAEEAAGLPPLPIRAEQFFAPPQDSSAPPASHPAHPPEEANYD